MSFTFADPKQLWLEISPATQTAAWQASQPIQAPGARWRVYLNQLCLQTCLDWLEAEFSQSIIAFPPQDANPVNWEVVTGSCLQLGNTKLVLLPSDTAGQDELLVPQEWVDIPSWIVDYYLAVKVKPDDGCMELWGYTTHRHLKTSGAYDSWDRVYTVEAENLTLDISVLLTTIERCPTAQTRADVVADAVSQPALAAVQAENAIAQLARPHVAFPRLSVPFAQWSAVLANATWRQGLYTQRLAALGGRDGGLGSLSQYLQGAMMAGWQSLETIFGAEAQQLAFAFRGSESEASQAKIIQFDATPNPQSVRLVLLWQMEADGRLAVRSQVYPTEGELYLPPNLTFTLLSDQDEVLQSIQSGEANNYIQMRRFRCPSGYAFALKIQWEGQTVTERLVA